MPNRPKMLVCATVVALCGLVSPGPALAVAPIGLFARVECVSIVPSRNTITVHFGVDNQTQSEIADPAINRVRPRKFNRPRVFAPGYTPDMFEPVFSTVGNPLIVWVLGDEANIVKLRYPYTTVIYGRAGQASYAVPSCR
jgi:hypothetical protein